MPLRRHPARSLILCVEDNERYLRLRKAVLKKAGYAVLSACSGSEALEIIREAPVSLVLSDHMLRGTTGAVLAKELKEIKPNVPIVLYSGTVPDSLKHVDGFINKDEPVTNVLMLIDEFIRRFWE